MKKVILLLAFATTLITTQAQVNFGAKGGMNLSTIGGDDVDDAKSKVGFNLGAFADVSIAESFSFRPELVFSTQGAKSDAADVDYKLNLSYLNIPLLGKYQSTSGFFAETGPQIGILVGAKAKSGDVSFDVKDDFKSTDFSWAFGLGYQMQSGFGINARYNLGLSNIADDGDDKIKNNVFQIGIFKTFGSAK